MAESFGYFGWLLTQLLGGLIACWLVTVPLLVLLVVAVFSCEEGKLFGCAWFRMLSLSVIGPLLVLAFGTALRARTVDRVTFGAPSAQVVHGLTLTLLFLLLVWAGRNTRDGYPVAVSALLGLWTTMMAWFIAIMSVTGDWL